MSFTSKIVLACIAELAGMLITLWLGVRTGAHQLAHRTGRRPSGMVQGAAFSLLGLLIGFSFYGAVGRLDYHRQLTVDEANAISTAYARLDLLPEAAQPALRRSFAAYIDTRIALYRSGGEPSEVERGRRASAGLERDIWRQAVAACPPSECPASTANLLLSSLNQVSDYATKQMMGTLLHPPPIVIAMLFGLSLICTFLVGFDMADSEPKSWPHMLAVPLILSVVVFVILDVEYPRRGIIRLDDFDELFMTLRQNIPLP